MAQSLKSAAQKELKVGSKTYHYFSLDAAKQFGDIERLPYSLKVLLENLLRHLDDERVKKEDIEALAKWTTSKKSSREIGFSPARVLMQDFTGVPAVVDLATMRQAVKAMGGNPSVVNPLAPVDLVIDHSVIVDEFGNESAFKNNVQIEFERNHERYAFLKWGQKAFKNFRVVPPGTGICHQVNLEYLAKTVWTKEEGGKTIAYPDTLVGTDSHTTMVNGLAVLGWGVGGIEAEAAMLGQPISMLIPEVIGFKLNGKLKEGTTATDLVLTVTQMLRAKGVVGKFVEFFGPGLDHLTLADRATIANMAPEYGATCGFFPIDEETIRYLTFTGRDAQTIALVKEYAKAQHMWRDHNSQDPVFTETLELDMASVEPCLAGPKRPQDRVTLSNVAKELKSTLEKDCDLSVKASTNHNGQTYDLSHGDVVIAAITSCTNTSNPSVLLGAGLLAQNALKKGLKVKPWVKTSLAPGSQVVTDYLKAAGVDKALDTLGFNLVGYGCTTCIGNSGPLIEAVSRSIEDKNLNVAAVLSGNRNFEGRINPHVKSNYLASPMLVVAYALAGSLLIDLYNDPIGQDQSGKDVFLKDIWPNNQDIHNAISNHLTPEMFSSRYSNVFNGGPEWQSIKTFEGDTYVWDDSSTYIKHPPFFEQAKPGFHDVKNARMLAMLGDSVTTDHISPAGNIKKESPAGRYLNERDIAPADFNSYGARRGNHEIMMRGTFANIRLSNELVPGVSGGFTKLPDNTQTTIFDASMNYQKQHTPLVVIAGKEYGTGSSRDWAAKGTFLLGVRAVIAESFERIHRSNLVGMGVLPLVFKDGMTRHDLKLDGSETFDIVGIENGIKPGMDVTCTINQKGKTNTITLKCRIDTLDEVEYYRQGGILQYVLKQLTNKAA